MTSLSTSTGKLGVDFKRRCEPSRMSGLFSFESAQVLGPAVGIGIGSPLPREGAILSPSSTDTLEVRCLGLRVSSVLPTISRSQVTPAVVKDVSVCVVHQRYVGKEKSVKVLDASPLQPRSSITFNAAGIPVSVANNVPVFGCVVQERNLSFGQGQIDQPAAKNGRSQNTFRHSENPPHHYSKDI